MTDAVQASLRRVTQHVHRGESKSDLPLQHTAIGQSQDPYQTSVPTRTSRGSTRAQRIPTLQNPSDRACCAWAWRHFRPEREWSSPRRPSPCPIPKGAWRDRTEGLTVLVASDRFRHFSLSFQSTFHRSIILLVHYRLRERYSALTRIHPPCRAAVPRSSTLPDQAPSKAHLLAKTHMGLSPAFAKLHFHADSVLAKQWTIEAFGFTLQRRP